MEKKLGRIERAYFGHCGYQDACIGLCVELSFGGYGACKNFSAWDAELIKPSEYTKWTEQDRDAQYAEIVRKVSKLLKEAKVYKVEDLKGKLVEVTVDGGEVKDWRILTEVL